MSTPKVLPRNRFPGSPAVKSHGPTWVHDWLTHLGVAVALGMTALLLVLFPLRAVSFQADSTLAIPVDFDKRAADYYLSQGLKLEPHSAWSLLKLLRSGPAYVITSEVMTNTARKAEPAGVFTKLYPETVVLASTNGAVEGVSDFQELLVREEPVYVDQGVSRLLLMSALALTHTQPPDSAQDFSAPRAKGLLEKIHSDRRLHTGNTPQELNQALREGWFCLTTDRRAVATPTGKRMVHWASAPTVTANMGIWERHPGSTDGTSTLIAPPPELFTVRDYPSLDSDFAAKIHAETVTNLGDFERFVWEASFDNDTYDGSWEWESTNESYELAGFIALLSLLSFWAGWRFWTAASTYVRWAVLIQAGILMFWILARVIKHASMGALERYSWYYYYVPIYATMTILFFVMSHSSRGRPPGYQVMRALVLGVGAALMLLVFTNDLHHLVLRFGTGQSGVDYSYGPGYYLYYLAVLVVFLAMMYVGLWTFKGNRLRLVAGIGFLFLVVVVYSVAYTLRVPFVRSTDSVQIYSIVFVLAWEVLFFIGAIGQNRGYVRFFENSQLPVEIVDNDWNTRFHTTLPLNLNDSVRRQLRLGKSPVLATDTSTGSPHTGYCQARSVSGGYVLWETDITAVQEFERTLATLRGREARQTEVLSAEYEAMLNMEESAYAPVLFDRLDDLMETSLARVQANTKRLDKKLDEDERSLVLRSIKMDLGYAKRAGLLTLQRFENDTVTVNTLTTFLSHSCTDFSYGNAVAGLRGPTTGTVQPDLALRTLEGLHRGLGLVIGQKEVTVFVNFEVDEAGRNVNLNWIFDLPAGQCGQLGSLLNWTRADTEIAGEDGILHVNMTIHADTLDAPVLEASPRDAGGRDTGLLDTAGRNQALPKTSEVSHD